MYCELKIGVKKIKDRPSPVKLVSRINQPDDTIIKLKDVIIGGKDITIIAGPCAVESKNQIKEVAYFLKANDIKILRGGVFKPRSSPYSFQGLGFKGLELIKEAGEETGLKIVCEVIDLRDIKRMKEYVDIFQVGTRNMYNYPLLKELGKIDKPIILKRALSATVEEWLLAAEYILLEGNKNVILCERGIRTFNTYLRNTLDISVIPFIKKNTHLPIIVDPSHSSGNSEYVQPLAKASIVCGADGIMVEIHKTPEKSYSDREQALSFKEFLKLKSSIVRISKIIDN